jgi:predicted PurR-regulated permease PerM
MDILKKLQQILTIKVPNWLGILCYTLLVVLIFLLIFVLLFPEQVSNFIIEHDIKLLQ